MSYSGALLQIQNSTGASVTWRGTTYVNGAYITMGKLVTYDVGFQKLWSSDTGRSITGENKGTLVGIFPKLKVKFGKLNDDDMSALINLTNVASTNVKYYDVGKKAAATNSFYFGDVTDSLIRQSSMSHKGPEFSIIANIRRI